MSVYRSSCSVKKVSNDIVEVTMKVTSKTNEKLFFKENSLIKLLDRQLIFDRKSVKTKYNDSVDDAKTELGYSSKSDYYYTTAGTEVDYFIIVIRGKLTENYNPKASLTMEFTDEADKIERITFEVNQTESPIGITSFKANSSLVQKNRNQSEFEVSYECTGAPNSIKLFENGIEIQDNLPGSGILKNLLKHKSPGFYVFTLEATKGDQKVVKEDTVLYTEERKTGIRKNPTDKTRIINFCSSEDGDYLYSFTLNSEHHLQLYNTNQIDGENWRNLRIKDIDKIKSFATSPMIHLQSNQERTERKLGRILLIGGSRLGFFAKNKSVGDKVAIITLDYDNCEVAIHDDMPWMSRFGHNCVVFPKSSKINHICLFGGQDNIGNAHNDIWVSLDGINWNIENKQAPWQARAMHSVSVSYKTQNHVKTREAIYLYGGFHKIGGQQITDIWKYDSINSWQKIADKIGDGNFDAFGIGYAAEEYEGDVGMYTTIIAKNQLHVCKLEYAASGQVEFTDMVEYAKTVSTYNKGIFIMAHFKDCLWFMRISYEGSSGMNCTELLYTVPFIKQGNIALI